MHIYPLTAKTGLQCPNNGLQDFLVSERNRNGIYKIFLTILYIKFGEIQNIPLDHTCVPCLVIYTSN